MSEFGDVRKILVIILRLIGDVLLSTPVCRALKENFPKARVTALVNSGTADVLKGSPLVDEIMVFDRGLKTGNSLERLPKEVSFFREIRAKGFDMTVSLTSGDRAAIASYLSGARYRLAYHPGKSGLAGKKHFYTHLAKKRDVGHKVLQYLDILRQFGIDTEDLSVEFSVPMDARAFARKAFKDRMPDANRKTVHIHPVSKRLHKCWRDDFVAEVIRWLDEHGVSVVVTSSPEPMEMEKTESIISMLPEEARSRVIDLCGKTTIAELAAVSEASDLFFGVDSAPMHLAAAVGTPVVAIFGAGERSWAPWGEGHAVITKQIAERNGLGRAERIKRNVEGITQEEVKEKLKLALDKPRKLEGAPS
jgi:heptosyltransferase-3